MLADGGYYSASAANNSVAIRSYGDSSANIYDSFRAVLYL